MLFLSSLSWSVDLNSGPGHLNEEDGFFKCSGQGQADNQGRFKSYKAAFLCSPN